MEFGTSGEAFGVEAVVEVLAISRSITCIHRALIHASSASGYQRSRGILGALGDDVDDSIDGVRSPDRPARSADDFDPVDVLEQRVLHFPIHAGKKRRVNPTPVQQHTPST